MHHSASVRLRLDLSYDGTDFSGWAAQPGLRTVQGSLEGALAMLLRVDDPASVRLTVGGRTDAGVHARGQVAHLDVTPAQLEKWTARRRPEEPAWEAPELARLRARKLTGIVSRAAPDVVVHAAHVVPAAFDARFSALRRRYEYRLIGAGMRKDPLVARYTAEVPRPLDFDAVQRASDELLGLNDFTTFCKAREGATAVRDLLRFEWRRAEDGAYAARIEADAFCHSMVRALIGAVVAVGSGRIDHEELVALRDARARTSRFTVMPAHGLSLEEIAYPPNDALEARAAATRARRSAID
ncbi:tRNA pseudouridine synthase A [Leucobacter manosquensis]|uniref:tRNA pseudouridine synthase A n=1 Tax=Leucobacter manosquensis TaxID=2810611 RepID=A0ABS5M864_9MICO|nr:tRNA pseudouridine synthase A [Leucobacter manosquensis]MBS3183397.1 tRNA pseudouridine(38-40) synthase TruA [Leucobacter manosquensis]